MSIYSSRVTQINFSSNEDLPDSSTCDCKGRVLARLSQRNKAEHTWVCEHLFIKSNTDRIPRSTIPTQEQTSDCRGSILARLSKMNKAEHTWVCEHLFLKSNADKTRLLQSPNNKKKERLAPIPISQNPGVV